MNRKLIITIHLALAAFFTPILLIVGISGGLYLIGEKGEMASETLYKGEMGSFTFKTKVRICWAEKRQKLAGFMYMGPPHRACRHPES